jgi:hypothetical protein
MLLGINRWNGCSFRKEQVLRDSRKRHHHVANGNEAKRNHDHREPQGLVRCERGKHGGGVQVPFGKPNVHKGCRAGKDRRPTANGNRRRFKEPAIYYMPQATRNREALHGLNGRNTNTHIYLTQACGCLRKATHYKTKTKTRQRQDKDKTRQDKTRQGKTRQGKTRQDKTKTRQDKNK